jgi:hypothetical protein
MLMLERYRGGLAPRFRCFEAFGYCRLGVSGRFLFPLLVDIIGPPAIIATAWGKRACGKKMERLRRKQPKGKDVKSLSVKN